MVAIMYHRGNVPFAIMYHKFCRDNVLRDNVGRDKLVAIIRVSPVRGLPVGGPWMGRSTGRPTRRSTGRPMGAAPRGLKFLEIVWAFFFGGGNF